MCVYHLFNSILAVLLPETAHSRVSLQALIRTYNSFLVFRRIYSSVRFRFWFLFHATAFENGKRRAGILQGCQYTFKNASTTWVVSRRIDPSCDPYAKTLKTCPRNTTTEANGKFILTVQSFVIVWDCPYCIFLERSWRTNDFDRSQKNVRIDPEEILGIIAGKSEKIDVYIASNSSILIRKFVL